VTINKPILYLAPIQGITNCEYRNIYSRLFDGYDFAVTPFIRSCVVTSNTCQALRDLFPQRNNTRFALIPQILSNNPSDFISIAKALFALGYKTVNLNLGCPIKQIRSKRRGAGMLPFPVEVMGMLNTIIPAIPNQLSIKVRLGSENTREFIDLVPLLNELPLKDIIVHPRVGSQMYEGDRRFDIVVKYAPNFISTPQEIGLLPVFNEMGEPIPLAQVTDIKVIDGQTLIARADLRVMIIPVKNTTGIACFCKVFPYSSIILKNTNFSSFLRAGKYNVLKRNQYIIVFRCENGFPHYLTALILDT